MTEDEIIGWHHRLNGHVFEQTLGVGNGHGSLACCSPWGCKESDTNERLLSLISVQSSLTLVTPRTAACPGFPVYHQLPELAQTHVH